MDRDDSAYLDIPGVGDKETYSVAEKKLIMHRLNEERRIHQRVQEKLDRKIEAYTEEEKQQVLHLLNEQRLSIQKREEIKKKRIEKKEKYTFNHREFYKFTKMEREYYIEVKECDRLTSRPVILTLYYKTFEEFKKKDVLIKTELYSPKFFVSYNPIRVYSKQYSLEDEKKK
ncbi:MAG: hypothetical protein COB07_08560 [Sulfurovum sp.]|nr:MAG: hypothetical protein COB07_08560 [Sulfurovum sp.]